MTTSTATPTRDQVAALAREFLCQELKIDPATIADDAVLKELPGADSVHLVRVVSRLERHWDREFEDEEVFELRRFDELVTLMLSHLGDGNS
jgi:acyl carrier protein